MPRPKKARRGEKPQWRKAGWSARVWEADGSCSGWTYLGTDNRELANKIYDHWLETGEKPETKRGKETFGKAALRIVDMAEKDGDIEPELAKDRRTRLRQYALPSLGPLEVSRVEPHHVYGVLEAMAKTHQKSAGTILKMRSDISQILMQLRREGAVKDNCARDMPLPKAARVDTRERRSLSEEQLLEFQRQRGFTRPLDLMILFSRQVGGHRTSDEHAGVWEEVDLVDFSWMKVRRPKTDEDVGAAIKAGKRRVRAYEKVRHEIDPEYRPHVRAYWEAQGRPTRGPIFPLLRGGVGTPMRLKDGRVVERKASTLGGHKQAGTSYAAALRRAVWECGLYDPDPGKPWDPEHPNPEHCRFQTDTETTLRLDFHSFRRDLNTALMEAGTATATQLAIMGHTQLSTGLRHYAGKRQVRVPDAALPGRNKQGQPTPGFSPEVLAALQVLQGLLPSGALPSPAQPVETTQESGRIPESGRKLRSIGSRQHRKSLESLEPPRGIEPLTGALGKKRGAPQPPFLPVKATSDRGLESPAEGVSSQSLGGLPDPRAELLATAARAVAAGDWALADQIRQLLASLPLASVHELSAARKRRL